MFAVLASQTSFQLQPFQPLLWSMNILVKTNFPPGYGFIIMQIYFSFQFTWKLSVQTLMSQTRKCDAKAEIKEVGWVISWTLSIYILFPHVLIYIAASRQTDSPRSVKDSRRKLSVKHKLTAHLTTIFL